MKFDHHNLHPSLELLFCLQQLLLLSISPCDWEWRGHPLTKVTLLLDHLSSREWRILLTNSLPLSEWKICGGPTLARTLSSISLATSGTDLFLRGKRILNLVIWSAKWLIQLNSPSGECLMSMRSIWILSMNSSAMMGLKGAWTFLGCWSWQVGHFLQNSVM